MDSVPSIGFECEAIEVWYWQQNFCPELYYLLPFATQYSIGSTRTPMSCTYHLIPRRDATRNHLTEVHVPAASTPRCHQELPVGGSGRSGPRMKVLRARPRGGARGGQEVPRHSAGGGVGAAA